LAPACSRTGVQSDMGHQLTNQPPASPGEIGHVLRERYVLVDRLGGGGNGKGTIFKARDRYRADLPMAQQYVAIKIVHATAADYDELLANLRCEFYRMQTLSHQNILNVFELDRDGEVDFYTMEFLEGELLSCVMGRLQPLPMSRAHAWAIIREIGSGLEYAHARNVVHGDLKPQNIMITHSGEVRILGFGAPSISSRQSPDDRLRPKIAFSPVRPAYASCEILDGRAPDPRDDIYAFACLSYELLAGAHPFQRRRSTEARHLGIVPRRPLGLSRRQWQAFTIGLSWHRAARSISVRAWLNKSNVGRAAAGRLPGARDLESEPADLRPATSLRATALFALLLICITVWLSAARLAGKIGGHAVAPAGETGTQLNPVPVPTPENAGLPASAAAVARDSSQVAKNKGRDLNRSKLPVVSASNHRVRSGERFAEIHVRRSSRLASDTPFVWWTEAASAKPGIDYVHQGKAIQSFPKGKNSTSFFVKLVPTSSRTQPQVFYIAIAEAGRGASSDQVARAAVWLPTNRGVSSSNLREPAIGERFASDHEAVGYSGDGTE
jgi:serine/threonine protein kinase